jgi:hypothetical protein
MFACRARASCWCRHLSTVMPRASSCTCPGSAINRARATPGRSPNRAPRAQPAGATVPNL